MAGVHFTGPVKNKVKVGAREWFQELPCAQDPDYIVFYNDFLRTTDYDANDWTITVTQAGAGNATEALAADELGGALKILNDDADDDVVSMQLNEENWIMAVGKRLWFEARVKVSDGGQSDGLIGLCVTDTTPRATTYVAGFQWADGDASINLVSNNNSTTTSTDSGVDFVNDTYIKLGMYWDGVSSLKFFINRSMVLARTSNTPAGHNLALTLNLQNGEAVAKSLTVDYVHIVQER